MLVTIFAVKKGVMAPTMVIKKVKPENIISERLYGAKYFHTLLKFSLVSFMILYQFIY
jgi:hypothetical protein